MILPALLLGLVTTSCNQPKVDEMESWTWLLPDHIPEPFVPEDNPMTRNKVDLGRILFHDFQLSIDGKRSCAVCHEQSKGFTDGFPRAVGHNGDILPHNSLSVANSAWRSPLMWMLPQAEELEQQAEIPLFQVDPPEMGMTSEIIIERIRSRDVYQEAFPAAFPDQEDPYTVKSVVNALASHQRRLVSVNSPYDLFISGEGALSASAMRGMELFESDRTKCVSCHGGVFFDLPSEENGNQDSHPGYFNTGLYDIDGGGSYPPTGQGLYAITGREQDMGKYRTPSLRNTSVTGPWGHDGSFSSLRNVLKAYARGGRLVESGENAGDGALNPWKDFRIQGFDLNDDELQDLLSFLESLTDNGMLVEPEFSDPFCRDEDEPETDCIPP